ncbi:NADAR family protein [Armatimonas sp.]|uniref:NADAR family protein n=1 Tax=Armatimonas sp. TaxID=1872638 RepID=UPI0037502C19
MPIKFYSKTNGNAYLSNFSSHGFELGGVYWPTVEHYFQAMKFPTHPEYQEKIRLAKSAGQAKTLGRTRATQGRTGTGKNRLGEILMETREGYRSAP